MMDMPNTPMADSGSDSNSQQQQQGNGQQQANNMFAAPYLGSGTGGVL